MRLTTVVHSIWCNNSLIPKMQKQQQQQNNASIKLAAVCSQKMKKALKGPQESIKH